MTILVTGASLVLLHSDSGASEWRACVVRTGVPEVRLTGDPESRVLDGLATYKLPAPEATFPGHSLRHFGAVSTLVTSRRRVVGWVVVLWEWLRTATACVIAGPRL